MFSRGSARPIPLLESDSDDSFFSAPTPIHRLSYTALVNAQPIGRYHRLALLFVCLTGFAHSLQLYLPLFLIRHLWCDEEPREMTLLAISYPLSQFIAPLFSAVVSRFALRARLSVTLALSMLLLLTGVFSHTLHMVILTRCAAGVLALPDSVLTPVWAHTFPHSSHHKCRVLVATSQACALAFTLLLLMMEQGDVRVVTALCVLPYIPAALLAIFLTESPLCLLRQGKYSHIMRAIETMFTGPEIKHLRLQDLDFSDDARNTMWNPAYLYSESRNKRSTLLLCFYKLVEGLVLAVLINLSSVSLFSEAGCTQLDNIIMNCTTGIVGTPNIASVLAASASALLANDQAGG